MAAGSDPSGKQALFSTPVRVEDGGDARATGGAGATGTRPDGRRVLYSHPSPTDVSVPAPSAPAVVGAGVQASAPGVLAVTCSTCGAVARVGVVEFLALQFPFGAWLPRRTFDRWMTCPVCRRRTWTSVTFAR